MEGEDGRRRLGAISRRALAIATIADVPSEQPENIVCGITKWCLNAAAMARLMGFGLAEVVVLTNNVSLVREECSVVGKLLRVLPFEANFSQLVDRWHASAHHNIRGGGLVRKNRAMKTNLLKWQYVGMTEYAVIYSSDLEVDHFFNRSVMESHANQWPLKLHRFRHMPSDLLATGDFESPFNGCTFLLKPNRRLFQVGVQVLETLRFNLTHGFNLSGRPHDLLLARDRVRFRLARAVQRNTWDFVGGNTDQGLFTYIYLMRERGTDRGTGRFDLSMHCPFLHEQCNVHAHLSCPLPVSRFWRFKPWLVQPQNRCPEYFDFGHLNASLDEVDDGHAVLHTTCAARLRTNRERVRTQKMDSENVQRSTDCGPVTQCIW